MRLALAFAVLVAASGLARADGDRVKLGIVPGIAVNLDTARVDALAQDLADALTAELDIDAIGGLEARRRLPAEGVPADCLTTPACITDVAQRLGANQLLFVVFVDATGSGAVQVDSTWVDVATGHHDPRPAIDVPSIPEAKPRFVAAAHELLPDAPVRPKPTRGGIDGKMTLAVPRHFTTASYASAGAAVVGLGVWAVFGLKARSQFNGCEASAACGESERDEIRTKTILADTGLAIGVAGAVVTGVLFATSGKESHLVVTPSAGGVALTAVGRF